MASQCSGHDTGSRHEYTLSELRAVAYSPDWLHQNISPPMESVRTSLVQYKWPEHRLTFMTQPVFWVLRRLLVFGRVSLTAKGWPGGINHHSVPL